MYRFTVVVCLTVLVLLASLSLADIPKLINYQGMLTNISGEPLNGTFDTFFRIYNAPSSGDKRWEENHSALSVNQGLFNVILGSQSGGIDLDFSEDYWLEVEVEGEVMPRIEFTSVGYAYRALVADSARSATPGSGSNWSISNSVLSTNEYWGIARGGAGNVLYGDSAHTMVNLGVACTTGLSGHHASYLTVSGGYGNSASWWYATVGGGEHNSAGGLNATVGGGRLNNASGFLGTVAGGDQNTASQGYATVGGGLGNTASYDCATVAGGFGNTSSGLRATVGGGFYNTASGSYSMIPGGIWNNAGGEGSFAAGWRAKALHAGSFVWADTNDVDFASTGANQFLIRASGGVGIGTTTPGTQIGLHAATSQYSSLAKNAYFQTGAWQRFNTSQGAYLHEVTPTGEVRFRVAASGTNPITWTNSLTIEDNGEVGILTTDPTEELDVNGSLRVRGLSSGSGDNIVADVNGVLMRESSSRRYKKNIRDLRIDPHKVLELNPVRFEWRTTGEEDIGLVAEQVEHVFPELVRYDRQGRPDAVKYDRVALHLLEAVKQLKEENEELQKRIEALEDR